MSMINEEKLEEELGDIRELAEENNKMLHKLYRHTRVNFYMRLLYWLLIAGATVGAFVFLKPYVDTVRGVYSSTFGETQENNSGIFDSIKNLLEL